MSYDKASPNNKPMFTQVDLSWAVYQFLISCVDFRRSTRKYLASQNNAQTIFLEGQNGAF